MKLLLPIQQMRSRTNFARVKYRSKILAIAVCIPIATMGAMCQHSKTSFVCPPLKNYSQAQQQRMADQYEHVEASNMAPDLLGFVNDSSDLRDAVRRCIARRKAEIDRLKKK